MSDPIQTDILETKPTDEAWRGDLHRAARDKLIELVKNGRASHVEALLALMPDIIVDDTVLAVARDEAMKSLRRLTDPVIGDPWVALRIAKMLGVKMAEPERAKADQASRSLVSATYLWSADVARKKVRDGRVMELVDELTKLAEQAAR